VTAIVIDILLAVAVLAAWLGAAGLLTLHTPLDRLHCVTFVNVLAGGALAIAAFVSDGLSDRAGEITLMVVLSLLSGGATAHAVGRALIHRGSVPEALEEMER
jgi:multicomponent Na+:H+ antiporter subunit G